MMKPRDDQSPLRVLLLSPTAQLGGAERILLDIIGSWREAIAAREIEVHVLTLGDGPLAAAARDEGAKVHVVPMPRSVARLGDFGGGRTVVLAQAVMALPGLPGLVRRMRRVLRQVAPHVVHSNGAKTHVLARWVMPRHRGTVLVWHIHDFLGRRPLVGRLLRHCSGRTSLAIAVSEAVAGDLRSVLPRTPVVTLLNAIDVHHFSAPPVFGEASDIVRVGLVATYARWKGQDVFLRAIAQLLRSNRLAATRIKSAPVPDFIRRIKSGTGADFIRSEMRFSIIGGPIYQTSRSQFSRAQLVALAEALQVHDLVEFVDFQSDPAPAYRALDVVVHASTDPEPFGRTIIEAMACGRAVIASAAGGAAELIRDGVDAIAVTPGDVNGLAEAIAGLATDPDLRQRLGAAARETAVRRFDRRRLGPQLLAIYRDHLPVRQPFGPKGKPSHTSPTPCSPVAAKKVESA